ncbi:SDR family oxidoreductase [Microbacterium invictum]|uniref:NAD(P)-dependent dehydrogenase (Short-subunit alcohol dehydrogenase family) n=1 Tax=Microbacterium invictum TaxID=515415 RepID=A0AA40SLN3_9MICO|nr:SDR family oxidoreductase [Microbacterium invictum]MBB4138390.1 NAD(P)-dependent dehydrogenase (short-subunit alcohol dehydrogenase family) [Microbacterium invictum]
MAWASRSARTVTLPDLHGNTALVTGASDGVGLEIARALAAAGCDVLMPVRNRNKGEIAATRIRASAPDADLSLLDLDLARLESVYALADLLCQEAAPIDVLVLNAGIVMLGDRERHVTEDGFELHFQTNYLGHVALTLGILPLLEAARARVVVQCSLAARVIGLEHHDLQLEGRYTALRAYGSSKVALGLFGTELARHTIARQWGLTVHLCHPGIAPRTAIAPIIRRRHEHGVLGLVMNGIGNSPERAAQPALMAVTTAAEPPAMFAPSGLGQLSGAAARIRTPASISDGHEGARLWDWTRSVLRPDR